MRAGASSMRAHRGGARWRHRGPLRNESIGVIIDADTDAAGTAASFETGLTRLTHQPVRNGAWTVGPPRVGRFVVPRAGKPGEIESLIWESWSSDGANAAAKACVETSTDRS